MAHLLQTVITILITIMMQAGAVNMVSSTPGEAAEDFLSALKEQEKQVMEAYMDNAYVNFLYNAEGDAKVLKRMNEALFADFSYKVEKIKQKEGVAVAKVTIASHDFSKVMEAYNTASYDYVMSNLYSEEIADKEALNAKCLEIYAEQIEKAAENSEPLERVVFVPMTDNGYHGWNIIVTDEFMASVLGNLQMPVQE